MKRKFIFTTIIAAVCVSVLFTGCRVLFKTAFNPEDPDQAKIAVHGIRDRVTIRRDSLGIPYIEAGSEHDLFYAAGYATAADRLWQMTVMKMAIQGRLSEIAGDEALYMDVFARTLDIKSPVERAMKLLDRRSRSVLESFAAGVNAWTATHDRLPFEFMITRHHPEPWQPRDSLYVFAMMNLMISYNFLEELNYLILAGRLGYRKAAYLFPIYPDEPLPLDEAEKFKPFAEGPALLSPADLERLESSVRRLIPRNIPASNNWAVSGRLTARGRTILANDTHLGLIIPSPWIIMHLKCPTYEAAGVTVPGAPVICLGSNGTIAWGVTMVLADSQDLYIERVRTEQGNRSYLYRGRWLPVEERAETFRIRGEAPVTIKLGATRHGVILNDALKRIPRGSDIFVQPMAVSPSYALAMRWAIEGMEDTIRGFYELGRSRSVGEARRSISMIRSIYLNFIFGDSTSIAWQVSGAYPMRIKGKGLFPSPGWNGEYEWERFLPFERHPWKLNPREGFLCTANERTVPREHGAVYSSSWYSPFRADLIRQRLSQTGKADTAQMIKLQTDQISPAVEKLQSLLYGSDESKNIRKIIAAWTDTKARNNALEALAFLDEKRFSGIMDRDSAPAAVMGAFLHEFTRITFMDELGPADGIPWKAFVTANAASYSAPEDHLFVRKDSPFFDDTSTPLKETRAHCIARALAASIELCVRLMGKDRGNWKWGKIHTYHWRHDIAKKVKLLSYLLNRGPCPAGGGVHTLNVSGFLWGKDFTTEWIPAMRFIADFGLQEPFFLISTPGQSGDPASPHYDDMIPYFLKGDNHPLPFGRTAVDTQYRNTIMLIPAP